MPDLHNFKELLLSFPDQLSLALTLGEKIKLPKGISNILVVGMGGSGIAADMLTAVLADQKILVTACKDYQLPSWVDGKTLVFCVTYSGDTAETLAAFSDAQKKKCPIICITSGGNIKSFCDDQHIPCVVVPRGYPPRTATGYLLIPMITILERNGYVKGLIEQLRDAITHLSTAQLQAKGEQLAAKLKGKTPIIYGSPRMACVAYRWKSELNENAKSHAFYNIFPELVHNEILAYSTPQEGYYVYMLRDEKDSLALSKQMDKARDIIKSRGQEVMEIAFKGQSTIVKLFTAMHLGDWVSYYHAMNVGVDPYPVDLISELKKKTGERK
ncbi:bifunctional phosphoglucose/phosphomannose isomerase [Candidatus Woesearchaeota archaeon]|nr:bifunctional phosphoglucose/phosphomannose isomerase [Candidatus Woesearchaeota archaeon]